MSRPLLQDTTLVGKTKGERLADAHDVTLVVRFVLNKEGKILHGELVDAQSTNVKRFNTWNSLICALSAWLNDKQRRG